MPTQKHLLTDDQTDFLTKNPDRYLAIIIALLKNIAKVLHQFLRYGIIQPTFYVYDFRVTNTRFSPRLIHFWEKLGVFRVVFGAKMHTLTGDATLIV